MRAWFGLKKLPVKQGILLLWPNHCKKLHMKMMMMTGALTRRRLTPWLQRSLLMNALTENFYALMPPTRIHQPVCLRNPPSSFMLKDISYVQDDADKGAIALQAYCPPLVSVRLLLRSTLSASTALFLPLMRSMQV